MTNKCAALHRLALLAILALALVGCRAVVRQSTNLAPSHRFKPTNDPVISSPVAWDFEEDGKMEIAVGSWDGHFYLLDGQLNDCGGWPKRSRKGFFSSPALVDLDADGGMEIVVSSDRGLVYAWNHDGSPVAGFPVNLGHQIWSSPTVLEGRLIAVGGEAQMHVLTAAGRNAPGWPQPMRGWADATAASDGRLIAITSLTRGDVSRGWMTAWSLDGDSLSSFPSELPRDSDSSPALVDFDGDGETWIVFGDDSGLLHAVATNGRERAGFPVRTLGPAAGPTPTPHPPGGNIHSIEASPAVADLDGDGHLEIAVGSWDGRMYIWDHTGTLLPGWPVQVGDQIISSAALCDLDGDDRLDVVVGSKDGNLYGWTLHGTLLPGFPHPLNAPVFSSPWVGDLDTDGRADIVVGADNGIHLLRSVGALGRCDWPMFHRDPQHTGAVP